jgi:hypothetical protein
MTTLFRIVIERTTGTCSSVISSGFIGIYTRHFSGKRKAGKASSLPHRIQVTITINIFNIDGSIIRHPDGVTSFNGIYSYARSVSLLAMENKWSQVIWTAICDKQQSDRERFYKSCPLLLVTMVIVISEAVQSIFYFVVADGSWPVYYLLSVQPPSIQSVEPIPPNQQASTNSIRYTAGSTIMYRL